MPSLPSQSMTTFQSGFWNLTTKELHSVSHGESTYNELRDEPIKSILPLMQRVNRGYSNTSIGGRCAAMSELRHVMVHSLFKPDSQFNRLSPSTIMRDANDSRPTEYSQETMARLLAIQLIGAGYNVNKGCSPKLAGPEKMSVIGVPSGFVGNGFKKTLLNGLSTRASQVEKVADFMQTIRDLARQYLRAHEDSYKNPTKDVSDVLSHRARLLVLAADPEKLHDKPSMVNDLLQKMDDFDVHGIAGCATRKQAESLASAFHSAKKHLLPETETKPEKKQSLFNIS